MYVYIYIIINFGLRDTFQSFDCFGLMDNSMKQVMIKRDLMVELGLGVKRQVRIFNSIVSDAYDFVFFFLPHTYKDSVVFRYTYIYAIVFGIFLVNCKTVAENKRNPSEISR